MFEKLSVKLSLTLLVIITVSLMLNAALNALNFQKKYQDFEHRRFEVYAQGLKEMVDDMLALGLTVPEMAALREKLEDFVRKNPDVLSVLVFDAKNVSRFGAAKDGFDDRELSRKLARIPGGAPDRALENHLETGSCRAVVTAFVDGFGEKAGWLVLHYGCEEADSAFAAMKNFLAVRLAAILAAAGFLAFLGMHLATAGFSRRIRAMTAALGENGGGSGNTGDKDIPPEFAAFREASARALAEASRTGDRERA